MILTIRSATPPPPPPPPPLFFGCAAEYSPFYGIEKGAVLQEARVFNDSQLDARRCAQVCGIARFLMTYFFFICQDSAAF